MRCAMSCDIGHNRKRTHERAKSVTYGMRTRNFIFTASDYANYLTYLGIFAPNKDLFYMQPSHAIDVKII